MRRIGSGTRLLSYVSVWGSQLCVVFCVPACGLGAALVSMLGLVRLFSNCAHGPASLCDVACSGPILNVTCAATCAQQA